MTDAELAEIEADWSGPPENVDARTVRALIAEVRRLQAALEAANQMKEVFDKQASGLFDALIEARALPPGHVAVPVAQAKDMLIHLEGLIPFAPHEAQRVENLTTALRALLGGGA